FSSRRRHTSCLSDWSSDVCSSDLSPLRTSIVGAAADAGRSGDSAAVLTLPRILALPPISCRLDALVDEGDLLSVVVDQGMPDPRSEERRVGKECRSGWWWWEGSAG